MKKFLTVFARVILIACFLAVSFQAAPAAVQPVSARGLLAVTPVSIDAFLSGWGSPLAGTGASFDGYGRQYNVDPRLIVAIAGAESSLAKNGSCATDRHNAWGYGGGWPNCWNFDSWDASIKKVTWQIREYRDNRHLYTIHDIGGTWCGSGCANWEGNVRYFYQEQGGNPDSNNLVYPSTPGEVEVTVFGAGFESSWQGTWIKIRGYNGNSSVSCARSSDPILTWTRAPGSTGDKEWARWRPNLSDAGYYHVYAYMPNYYLNDGANTPSSQVRYQVTHANGTTMVVVDQTQKRCDWADLGRYYFNAGNAGFVYMGDYTGDTSWKVLAADGVKFVWDPGSAPVDPPPSGSDETIVDDGDQLSTATPGWITTSTAWTRECTGNAGDAHYTWSRRPGYSDDVDTFQWAPNLARSGVYEVYRYVPGIATDTADTARARYVVHHAGGDTVVEQAQKDTWCSWVSLGKFVFNAGNGGYVKLGDYTGGESPMTTLAADAVKWVYRSGVPNDTTAPSGQITSPANNAVINNPVIDYQASAVDDSSGTGVDKVEFYVNHDSNWDLVGTDYSAPYQVTWVTPAGMGAQQLTFAIHITDRAGNEKVDAGGYVYAQYNRTMSIADAAKNELGMPYWSSMGRGKSRASGPYGPWHYEAGVCTDVVIDSYVAGAGVNWSWDQFYRNANTMEKYFKNNELFLSDAQPYQVGDILFLENKSGTAEHVGVITAVNSSGRPTKFIHTPQPGKVAVERDMFYGWCCDLHVAGHGRLKSGSTAAPALATSLFQLSIFLETRGYTGAELYLIDPSGRYVTRKLNMDYTAPSVPEYSPYLLSGMFDNEENSQWINVSGLEPGNYRIEVHGKMYSEYSLSVALLENGIPVQNQDLSGTIGMGQVWSMPLTIAQTASAVKGQTALAITSINSNLTESGALGLPDEIYVAEGQNTVQFTVTELSGKAGIDAVQIQPSDLRLGAVDYLPAGAVTISPSSFSLAAGGSQTVTVTIDPFYQGRVHGGAGFLGNVTLTTGTAGNRVVPLQWDFKDMNQVFIPALAR